MKKYLQKFDNIIKIMLLFLNAGLFLYLFLLCIFSTSAVEMRNFSDTAKADWGNYNFYVPDNAVIQMLVLIVVLLVCWFIHRKRGKNFWVKLNKYKWFIYGLFFVAGCFFIFTVRLRPSSDPGKVMRIAEQMVKGDYSQFRPVDGYLWRCPHQLGIVFLCYCLTNVFGKYNYLAFQLINLLMLICGMEIAGKIGERIIPVTEIGIGTAVRLLYLIFFPYFLYVTFIYGTIPAFVLSMTAIYMEMLFFQTKRWKYALATMLSIGVAIIIKPNSKIILVAIISFLIYDVIMENRKLRSWLSILLMCLGPFLMTQGVNQYMSWHSGYEISEGQSMMGYVAMGLQESRFAPGAYNGHSLDLYKDSNYDYEEATRLSLKSIKKTLEKFDSDKSEAVRWLGRKIASQWNDPTFGGIEVNRYRETEADMPACIESIIYGRGSIIVSIYLNYLQTIILAGGFFYFLLLGSKQKRDNFILSVIIFGGFIFHIFWEGKSQYVLPYFLMLLPYSVCGYFILFEKADSIWEKHKEGELIVKKIVVGIVFIAISVLLFTGVNHTRLFQYMVAVHDEEALCDYYHSTVNEKLRMHTEK